MIKKLIFIYINPFYCDLLINTTIMAELGEVDDIVIEDAGNVQDDYESDNEMEINEQPVSQNNLSIKFVKASTSTIFPDVNFYNLDELKKLETYIPYVATHLGPTCLTLRSKPNHGSVSWIKDFEKLKRNSCNMEYVTIIDDTLFITFSNICSFLKSKYSASDVDMKNIDKYVENINGALYDGFHATEENAVIINMDVINDINAFMHWYVYMALPEAYSKHLFLVPEFKNYLTKDLILREVNFTTGYTDSLYQIALLNPSTAEHVIDILGGKKYTELLTEINSSSGFSHATFLFLSWLSKTSAQIKAIFELFDEETLIDIRFDKNKNLFHLFYEACIMKNNYLTIDAYSEKMNRVFNMLANIPADNGFYAFYIPCHFNTINEEIVNHINSKFFTEFNPLTNITYFGKKSKEMMYKRIDELIKNKKIELTDEYIAKVIAMSKDFDKLPEASNLLDVLSKNIVIDSAKSYSLTVKDNTYTFPVFDMINKTNYEIILTDSNIKPFAEYVIATLSNKKNSNIDRIFMEIMNTEKYTAIIDSIINSSNLTAKIFNDVLLLYGFHIKYHVADTNFEFSNRFDDNFMAFFKKTNDCFVKKLDFTNGYDGINIILAILSADNNNMKYVIDNIKLSSKLSTEKKLIIGIIFSLTHIYEYCIKNNTIDTVKESMHSLSKNITKFIVDNNVNLVSYGTNNVHASIWLIYKMLEKDKPLYLNENPIFEQNVKLVLENMDVSPISIYGTTQTEMLKSLKFISKSDINNKSSPILQYLKIYEDKPNELTTIINNLCTTIYNLLTDETHGVSLEEIKKHLKLDNDILFSKLQFHVYLMTTIIQFNINEIIFKKTLNKLFEIFDPISQEVHNKMEKDTSKKYISKIRDSVYVLNSRKNVMDNESKDIINVMFMSGLIPQNIDNKQTIISQSIFSIDIERLIESGMIIYDDFCTIQTVIELIMRKKIKSAIVGESFKKYLDEHILEVFLDHTRRYNIVNKSDSNTFIDLYELGYLTDAILSISHHDKTAFDEIVLQKCPELLNRFKIDNPKIISKHLKSIIKNKKLNEIVEIINEEFLKDSELESFESLFLGIVEFDKQYIQDFLFYFSFREDTRLVTLEILKKYPDKYLDYNKFDINKMIELIISFDLLKEINNEKLIKYLVKNNVSIDNIKNLINCGLELTYELYKSYPQLIFVDDIDHKYLDEIISDMLVSEYIYTNVMSYNKKTIKTLTKILVFISENDQELFFDTIINYDIDREFFTINKDKIMDKIINGIRENGHLLSKILQMNIINDDHEFICKLKNKFGNYTLSYVTDRAILHKYLPKYTISMFEKKNVYGDPRLMSFLENTETFDEILPMFNPKKLEHIRDRFNNNIYTYVIKYNACIEDIVPPYAYVEIDSSGRNGLMRLCKINPINEKIIYSLCESEQGEKLLNMYDNNGNSGYHYIVRYTNTILQKLIKSYKINLNTINCINKHNETLLMHAIKYNKENALIMLDNEDLSVCQFFSDYSSGSALTYAIKYNQTLTDKIISHKNFNYTIMKVKDKVDHIIDKNSDDMIVKNPVLNVLQIALLYNIDVLKKIIKISNRMSNILMKEEITILNNKTNALLIALFNNPDCAQYLAGIDMCDEDYIDRSIKILGDDPRILIDYQPYSLYHVVTLAKFKGKFNLRKDVHFYGYNPESLFENKDSLKYMLQFIQDKQEFPTSDKDTCPVCVTFKTKVLNTSCKHSTCISCSLKTSKCSVCRHSHKSDDGKSLRILI